MAKYSRAVWTEFIGSFKKFSRNYFIAALYDVIFWVICAGILLFNNAIAGAVFRDFNPESITTDPEIMFAFMAKAIPVLAMVAVSLLIIFFLHSLFRALIWSRVIGKKFRFRIVWRMLLFNLVCGIVNGIAALLIAVSLAPRINKFALIPIFIMMLFLFHICVVFYYFIVKEEKGTLKNSFKIGFGKIGGFALPYLLVLGVLIILSAASYPITYLPQIIENIISAVLLILFASWARFFFVRTVKSIERHK